MSLVVNNNLMAANTARNLNAHYGRLATSTQRLSSGLRINSAADDAAGLAIRELQRADISALQQGARNANDAISMIQVADGSLGIIDEKLIRMKELAEQAATGTYDSTQRLMIESEYQAMASEITRIANATDFNGTKLLDGTLSGDHDGSGLVSEGKMKIHFGTGNDSAEDYYYVEIGECTSEAFGLGNASTWQDVTNRAINAFQESLAKQIKEDDTLTSKQKGQLLAELESGATNFVKNAIDDATNPLNAYQYWGASDEAGNDTGFLAEGKNWVGNSTLMEDYLAVAGQEANDVAYKAIESAIKEIAASAPFDELASTATDKAITAAVKQALLGANYKEDDTLVEDILDLGELVTPASFADADAVNTFVTDLLTAVKAKLDDTAYETETAAANDTRIMNYWDGLRTTEKEKLQYAWGQAAIYNLANAKGVDPEGYGIGADPDYTFSGVLNAADDNYADAVKAADNIFQNALEAVSSKVGHMDFAGHTIETQEDAQHALDAINDAIVSKDKIRAHLGATQNRLENTVSNLNIQAENLQAAESRISDVDVATEMTQFVRNQILTQSAVAMLSQANSLPQMAMQLIGG